MGKISLAFITGGGAGSIFLQANFIYCVKEYLKNEPVSLVVFGHKSNDLNEVVFGDGKITTEYYSATEVYNSNNCDVVVQLNFYPQVLKENEVVKQNKKVHELLEYWQTFLQDDKSRQYCLYHPYYDVQSYIYAINNNKNCVNCFDIKGILGMSRDYVWSPDINIDEKYLRSIGLEDKKFITIQWGASPGIKSKEGPKIWPKEYYAEFNSLFHKYYPEYRIVQLGELTNSEEISGVDINLLGKTTWKELGTILKAAWFHVDGECGMVHYRKAIGGGPSIVLFGPTPLEFYGYEDNINIRSNVCVKWCARLVESWAARCIKGDGYSECMKSIMPGQVLMRIFQYSRIQRLLLGEYIETSENEKLFHDDDIIIDEKYKTDFLTKMCVLHYEIVKVKVGSLSAHFPVDGKFEIRPLKESPAYAMALGDTALYKKYVEELQSDFGDDVHALEKCAELYKKLDNEGISQKKYVIIDSNNLIQDGQHRASWYMAKNGEDAYIDVLRLYALKDDEYHAYFPFDLVERRSRVVIYGAGISGKSYVEELKQTKYADVVCILDRKPDIWNHDNTEVVCYEPNHIATLQESDYDYVVIAIQSRKVSEEVKRFLVEHGVPREKIVARVLKRI